MFSEKKKEPPPEPESQAVGEEPVQEEKQEPVQLSNPKWEVEAASFHEEVQASVSISIPELHKGKSGDVLSFMLVQKG